MFGEEGLTMRQRRRGMLKVTCEAPRLVPPKRRMQRGVDVQRAKLLPNLGPLSLAQ
jgi:hypothetical protein